MEARTISIIVLVAILVIAIATPVVIRLIQDRDGKRQLKGDIPFREWDSKDPIPQKKEYSGVQAELDAAIAKSKTDSVINSRNGF